MGVKTSDGGTAGPSWWDCERFLGEICARHDVSVYIETTCSRDKSTGRYSWHLRAVATPQKRLNAPPLGVGAHGFRGNSGAATYTAALYMALGRLDVNLTEEGGQARMPGF